MNEDLYELMMDGAFSSKEEFNDFISGATQKEIYSLVTEGAFESFEEFNSIFNDNSVKKKRKFKGYFSRGRYGFTYRTSGGRTYLCGIFCSSK